MDKEIEQKEWMFKKLLVWQKSSSLTHKVCKVTALFPREFIRLRYKIRHACASIPAFIAEGYSRNNNGELKLCLNIAMDSIVELQYLLMHVYERGIVSNSDYCQLTEDLNNVKNLLAERNEKLITDKLKVNNMSLVLNIED